ncbi:MAG TPA: thioredoxin domain-containing protein [Acetobacteraceae bacterium]|nr:thioredoxin domain-containing protein [Acetobacteraceae bacterium]
MPLLRRSLLAAAAAASLPAIALGVAPGIALAAAPPDPALGPRTLGDPKAKVHVIEYFSLTCTHCADFANETMPEVERKLITPGKVYWIFRDFPLDRVALTAAMVARALPPDRYAPFVFALFASQDRWAFAPDVNSTAELEKTAALAGMSSDTFKKAIADKTVENFILGEAREAQEKYHVDSTPTFIINGQPHAGEMPYADFANLIAAASG